MITLDLSKHPTRLLTVVLLLSLSLVALAPSVRADSQSSYYTGPQVNSNPTNPAPDPPCPSSTTILLIQDNIPWKQGFGLSPLGADVDELSARHLPFCIQTSLTVASWSLATLKHFGTIIIPSAQSHTYYNNLFPSHVFLSTISAWVALGGVLSANLADCASGAGLGGAWGTCTTSATSYTFVGGVKHTNSFGPASDDLTIASPGDPLITGVNGGANGGVVVDIGTRHDLDNWGSSAHGYFTNLPTGTSVILKDGLGRPVMIEYDIGPGVVVATMATVEWMYGASGTHTADKKLLANDIGWQTYFNSITVNLNLLSYKIVNVLVEVVQDSTVIVSTRFTLTYAAPTTQMRFFLLYTTTYNVRISGYSIATQTQPAFEPATISFSIY